MHELEASWPLTHFTKALYFSPAAEGSLLYGREMEEAQGYRARLIGNLDQQGTTPTITDESALYRPMENRDVTGT
jgi:hypothetical protein